MLFVGQAQAVEGRPFGADAPWNIPIFLNGVQIIDDDPNAVELGRIFHDVSPQSPGNIELTFGYQVCSIPIYLESDATGRYPVVAVETNYGNLHGRTAPFSAAFLPCKPGQFDYQVIVIDEVTGEEWNFFEASFDGTTIFFTICSQPQAGNINDTSNSNFGDAANRYEKEDGWEVEHEYGIQYSAGMILPEEIERGVIAHSMITYINNVDGCTHRLPAQKHEHPERDCGIENEVIEVGTRFYLDVTDAEIETHLDSRPSDLPQSEVV